MAPNKTMRAFLGSRKIIEDKSIKRNPAKINQKVPTSNIVPKKDTEDAEEKNAERRKTIEITKPENKSEDLGNVI